MHKAVEDYLAIKAYKREQRKRKIDALLRRLPIKPSTMAKLAACILAIAFGLWLTKLFVENNTKTRRQIAASAEANAKWQAREKLELAELSKGPAWVRWMQDAEHRKRETLNGTRTPSQLWCDHQIERALRETRGLTPTTWKPGHNLKNQPWCREMVERVVWNVFIQDKISNPLLTEELENKASDSKDE